MLLVQSGGVDSMPVYPIRRELAEEAQCPGSERRNRWDCPATHFWLRWDDGADRSPLPAADPAGRSRPKRPESRRKECPVVGNQKQAR